MVRSRKKGFVRKGEYVEIRVPMGASYREVAAVCASVYTSSSEDEEGGVEATLFRANGTMTLDSPIQTGSSSTATPWDIGSYMSVFPSFHSSGVAIKLGMGYTVKVFWDNQQTWVDKL